jgi:hypothetical protein
MTAPRWLAGLAVAALAGACAGGTPLGWDGVVDVTVGWPEPEPGGAIRTIDVAAVSDRRDFRPVAHALRTPSLRTADDPRGRARAVGRRQGTRGGNLWLAEGQTVGSLAAEVTARALARAGVRPVRRDRTAAPTPDDGVAEVEIEVLAFWTWVRAIELAPDRVESEIVLRVRTPGGPLAGGALVCGQSQRSTPTPSALVWSATLQAALDDLGRDLDRLLSAPDRPAPTWRCRMPESVQALFR